MESTGRELIDPFDKFQRWYSQVYSAETENSNAMVLSTATRQGRVSSRVVLLKQYDREGFVFFTNYNSRKGKDLSSNIYASLLFHWPDKRRQVRIEGVVERTTEAESDNYFNSRIKGHKINAIVSDQSSPVESPEAYLLKQESAEKYYNDRDPERPPHWGGFRLVPDRFEFWEEGKNRFHTRIEFLHEVSGWTKRQLQP